MTTVTLGALDLTTPPFIAMLGTSTGEWVPITTTIDSLYVDGSVVTGDSTGNREIALKVYVEADTRLLLAQACEALVSELNAPANLLTVVPDGGPPQVYETFRASQLQRSDDEALNSLRRVYEVSVPAKPFVRGDTRLHPAAAAPVVGVEDFEGSPIGVAMVSPARNNGSALYFSAPVASNTATPIYFALASGVGDWPTVAGATVASVSTTYFSTVRNVARFTGAGVDFTASTTAWPCGSGDFVTVALGVGLTPSQKATVGLEWLDASGTSLGTDWGIPIAGSVSGHVVFDPWVTSRRPSGATQVRALLTATLAGDYVDVVSLAVMPAGNIGSLTQSATANYQGAYGLNISPSAATGDVPAAYLGALFLHGEVPPWVDVSGLPTVGVWVKGTASQILGADAFMRLRFYDAGGNWSQWDLTGTLSTGWVRCVQSVDSPSGTSGTLDLTAVVSYDLSVVGAVGYKIDYVHAGPESTALLSTRGTVLTLDIVGSAPSTAAAVVSNNAGVTDWLLACIDGTEGEPLLTVASNVATAPSGYDGTYQVLGALSPAAALTTPTCVVAQLIGGTSVATRTLTGTTRAGNAYVDFGSVELPLVAVPDENASVTYTFTLAPSSTSWVEVLVIDVMAAMVLVDNLSTARKVGFVDEPELTVDLSRVWVGDLADRSDARAPLNPPNTVQTLQVKAPSTRLLVYSTGGAPDVALSYWPRWLAEPTS